MKKLLTGLVVLMTMLGPIDVLALNPALMASGGKSADKPPAGEVPALPENLRAEDIDALMARLNDEQVRRLLIAELQAEAATTDSAANEKVGGLAGIIRGIESATNLFIGRAYALMVSLPSVPGDLKTAVDRLTDFEGIGRLLVMIIIALCFLAVGWAVEKAFLRFTAGVRERIETMPGMEGILKFWGALVNILPDFLGLFIFAVAPLLAFFVVADRQDRNLRLLFLAFLMVAVIIRFSVLVLRLFFAPKMAKLRLLPLSCEVARYLHRRLLFICCAVGVSYVLLLLMSHLEVNRPAQIWLAVLLTTTIILLLAGMIWSNRAAVKKHLLGKKPIACEKRAWLREQSASMWHILALAYLFLIWLLGFGKLVTADAMKFDGTFILSLLIVPIYLALDQLAQWCVVSVFAKRVGALAAVPESDDPARDSDSDAPPKDDDTAAKTEGASGEGYQDVARRVVRAVVFVAVALWFLDIWGFQIAFGEEAVGAVVDILITLLLAHIVWELISNAINRKLEQAQPDEEENQEDDDEWGGAGAQDRSFTLLPMLRKFIGAVMIVMVTLIVLSSMGINIGPLLAGAGVIGLAIGFGAQKLVRDILSGIFFLMDDAFRVGEYLDAGGISGTVEQITLRTIKLRHHRGMLQIVPLGDLASITNYMRGGIVVKFDLQLPYDTDIDKVRKIIKKVGKAMLLDEDLGPDFIKPVKSQGVRSVGDSVMTFRVKFTARPGKHFVIRREAFKRITEALEKKGIHYAHRKVIVDLAPGAISPGGADGGGAPAVTPEQREQMLQAGAAAALDTLIDQESQDPKAGKKKQKDEIF